MKLSSFTIIWTHSGILKHAKLVKWHKNRRWQCALDSICENILTGNNSQWYIKQLVDIVSTEVNYN